MKVKDLIELLQLENPNATVVARGYETGYNEINSATPATLIAVPGEWYDGTFERLEDTNLSERLGQPFEGLILT